MTRRAIAQAVAALCLATVAAAGESPYVIRLDLRADIRNLGSDDLFVSEPAADHLTALGSIALPALAAALRREPPAIRAGVVGVLQQIEGEEAVALLVVAAEDRDPAVRADALVALGLRKATAGRAVVERHLTDSDHQARRAAALACHALCTSPAALDQLAAIAVRDHEASAAQQSLHTIVASDPARAPAARAAIEARALPALADPDRVVRANAGITAALVGRREAIPVLVEVIHDPPQPALKPMAALALGGIPDAGAVAALAQLVQSGDPPLHNAACVGLNNLRQRDVDGAAQAAAACTTATP